MRWNELPPAPVTAVLLLLAGGCVIDISDVDLDGDDGVDSRKVEVSATFSRVLSLEEGSSFRLLGTNGAVIVRGGEGSREVRIVAVRRVRSHTREDAEDHLAFLRVEVTAEAGGVLVRTAQPKADRGRSYAVDYEISLPRDVQISVQNGNGGVTLRGLHAWAGVEAGNGDVVLDAHAAGARVSLGNGEIRSHVVLPPGGELQHSVGNGGIHLTLPRNTSARLTARIGNGGITLSELDPGSLTSSTRTLDGVLGSGDGIIHLSAGNGWIRIRGQ